MKKNIVSFLLSGIVIISLATLMCCAETTQQKTKVIDNIFNAEDIISLFNITVDDITTKTPFLIAEAKNIIDSIVAIPVEERTYANTAQPLDEVLSHSDLAIIQCVYHALELLHPDEKIRNAAHDAFIIIQAFFVDYVMSNKALYNAFVAYASQQKEYESLSAQQHYFINDTIDSFKRQGLSLSDEMLAAVNILRKELSVLSADFDRNIAQDQSFITVTHDELAGLSDDFIAALKTTDDGFYILGVDYPTYFRVMENCSITETRKKLYTSFYNRAYPANEELLKIIIAKRDELARLLGYIDYAHCDIDEQMVHTPERAQAFIDDMIVRAAQKTNQEYQMLTHNLPGSVQLTADGKMQPWDRSYVQNMYKKMHYNLDEQKIAEYFPMQKTVAELLDIYRQFFSIDFKEETAHGLWHEDVSIIRVVQDGKIIGTLMLDLYPRPNKYNHAAQVTIVPSVHRPDGNSIPNVSIVIANFSKSTSTQPSLLKRSEVKTFFHEFGHALHDILGATEIASLSGTHTKTDFVELPSQMLEEWLYDRDILKKISGHYITGEPLSDDTIDTIIALKNLTSGHLVIQEGYFANMALSYFKQGEHKDPYVIMKQLHDNIMTNSAFFEDNHIYASFGHLTNYGAKYYGYLWSLVFALDIFAEIKKHDLLNPEIGRKYAKEILSKGGAQDPNELLYNFLGREPNSKAFFEEMGL